MGGRTLGYLLGLLVFGCLWRPIDGIAQTPSDNLALRYIGPDWLLNETPYDRARTRDGYPVLWRRLSESWNSGVKAAPVDGTRPDGFISSAKLAQQGFYNESRTATAVSLVHEMPRLMLARSNTLLVSLGNDKLFRLIPDVFKREQTGAANEISILALGWIRWNTFKTQYGKTIHSKGECDPDREWEGKQCLEEWAPNHYVIKRQQGHTGWPIDTIGAASIQGKTADFFAWLGTDKASEVLADYFVVVPHTDVRKKRIVTFMVSAQVGGPAQRVDSGVWT